VPAGSLRLAEVTAVATRRQVTEAKPLMDILAQSNVGDADVRDGCVALARIYCCGGPSEEDTAVMVYVPDDVAPARAGDVVELRVGRPASGGKAPRLNTVTRVRQRRGEAAGVRWVPEDDRMWTRVLYADWMRADGWVEQGGLWHAWYKPPGK
jgi:hypothetical protein